MNPRLLLYALPAMVLLVLPLVIEDAYWMHLIIMSALYMMLASSLDIIYGYAGQINLGQAAFASIGAYVTALLMLRLDISFWVALPLSGFGAAFFGMLLGFPTLRLRGLYLGIATMGFSEIVRLSLLTWRDLTRGPMGLPGIPSPTIGTYALESKADFYYLIVILLLLTIVSIQRIVHSRVGRAWIAIREDETAAMGMGINTSHYKVMAFTLGAFFAGLAGSFYAVYVSFVSPDAFKMMDSYLIFAMPAVGGMGTAVGPLIGAIIIYVLPEVTRVFADYRMLWVGALLVVVMVSRPQGIYGGILSFVHWLQETRRKPGAVAVE